MELIDKIQRQLDANHYIEAEDIQKLIDAQKWIAVEDRLPEDREQVNILCNYQGYPFEDKEGVYYVRTGYYKTWANANKWYIINNGDYFDGGYGQDYECKVTHWKPLPEPPTV